MTGNKFDGIDYVIIAVTSMLCVLWLIVFFGLLFRI